MPDLLKVTYIYEHILIFYYIFSFQNAKYMGSSRKIRIKVDFKNPIKLFKIICIDAKFNF